METLFECVTRQSKDNLREMAARILRVKLIIHGALLAVLALGFGLFVLLRGLENIYAYALLFGAGCIGLAAFRFVDAPQKYAESTYSSNMKLYNNEVSSLLRADTVAVYNRNSVSGVEHRYEWEELLEVLETKHLLILKTRKKNVILIEKAGFTKGTAEDFAATVRQKRKQYLGQ